MTDLCSNLFPIESILDPHVFKFLVQELSHLLKIEVRGLEIETTNFFEYFSALNIHISFIIRTISVI